MLIPGEVDQLDPWVRRIVAPNPGPMTGPGTNTYLVGQSAVAVIDPGPAYATHIDAIIEAGQGNIRWILCTHTHPDHSPAAALLAKATGATLVGAVTADDQHQDLTFQPDQHLEDEAVIADENWSIRAIHTPGHVDNHYCFLLEQNGMVFAGDHIMNGSTVVIIPPGGNMQHYIHSLRKLLDHDVASIAPGHGGVIDDCRGEVEKLVRHRLMREAKVISALEVLGPSTLDQLVLRVYDDVKPDLHEWAKLSLHAHVLKLQAEHRASLDNDQWHLL
jgi:glyoxylase-like metal-dependent hydrolase (beta-lactamase superfamily II)